MIFGKLPRGACVIDVDRLFRLTKLAKIKLPLSRITARQVSGRIKLLVSNLEATTFGDGKGLAERQRAGAYLNYRNRFSDTYASWQRGKNRNAKKPVRQCLPTCCDLTTLAELEVRTKRSLLKYWPMKNLSCLTAHEFYCNTQKYSPRAHHACVRLEVEMYRQSK